MKWEFVKATEWAEADAVRVRFFCERFNLIFDVKKTVGGFGYRMYVEMNGERRFLICQSVPVSKTILLCDIVNTLDIFRAGYNLAVGSRDYLRRVCIDDIDFIVARLMEIVEGWK
ncbi:hypothetical protein [Barnesiella intestinihominis]|uniref:hypothetical protein n=1 Tax=Barnesiella intestinihominis TaxID=487174 RepID=UPI003AB7CA3C